MSRYEYEDDRYESRDDDRYESRDDDRYESHDDDRYEVRDRSDQYESHVYAVQTPTATTAPVAYHIDDDADGKAFRLYMAALDRTPDSSGLANWMSVIRSGVELDDVASGFVNSAEFQQKYGSLDNGEYVNQLYHNVLDRDADEAGYANWVNVLESGQTREFVLVGFSESTENQMQAAALVNGVDYQAWVG